MNHRGLLETPEVTARDLGFENLEGLATYLYEQYNFEKDEVLRGPDVDIVIFAREDASILLVIDPYEGVNLRSRDLDSNEAFKEIAIALAKRRKK